MSLFQSLFCSPVVFRLKILNVIKIIYLYRYQCFNLSVSAWSDWLLAVPFHTNIVTLRPSQHYIITSRLPPFRFLASCLVTRTDSASWYRVVTRWFAPLARHLSERADNASISSTFQSYRLSVLVLRSRRVVSTLIILNAPEVIYIHLAAWK